MDVACAISDFKIIIKFGNGLQENNLHHQMGIVYPQCFYPIQSDLSENGGLPQVKRAISISAIKFGGTQCSDKPTSIWSEVIMLHPTILFFHHWQD